MRAADPVPGIFGGTSAAADADAVISRTHRRHLQALDDHLSGLQWVTSRAAETIGIFDETDRDAAPFITKAGAFGEQV
jgi:hypothetical protein